VSGAEELPLDWLRAIADRKRPDGTPYYQTEELNLFIVAFLLTTGFDPSKLPPSILALIEAFAIAAGVDAKTSKAEAEEKFQAFLQKHPLNPELVFEVRRALVETKITADRVAGAFAKYLAGPERKLPSKERPKGTTPGGPLARFTIKAPGEE
jgi:hypothetical protein